MTSGGVFSVPSNESHGAMNQATMADAYVVLPEPHAACHGKLTSFDFHSIAHWQHSINEEHNFLNPYAAVLRAWKLSWETICDDFQWGRDSHIISFPAHDNDFVVQLGHAETDGTGVTLSRSCAVAPRVQKEKLHSCLKRPPGSNEPQKATSRKVLFQDNVAIYIGLEDTLTMAVSVVPQDALLVWPDKPWARKAKKKQRFQGKATRDRRCVSFAHFVDAPQSERTERSSGKQARITDYHTTTTSFSNTNDQTQNEQAEGFPVLHQPPQFVMDIFGLPGIQVLPHETLQNDGLLIRTWYIHHQHRPRWKVPRIVELDQNWHLWQREIVRSWRDVVQHDETPQIFVVQPDPERHYLSDRIKADVIVVQGDRPDNYAGLLTVHESFTDRVSRSYALALSLPTVSRQQDIVSVADLEDHCQRTTCRLYFRWEDFDDTTRHRMRNGDGFSLHITPSRDSHLASVVAQADTVFLMQQMKIKASRIKACNDMNAPHWYHEHTAQGGHANLQNQLLQDDIEHHGHFDENDEESDPNEDPATQPPPDDDEARQAVLMFHLAEAPIHAMLDWTDWPRMIREVAYHYSVDRENVLDCYEMTVKPPDIPVGVIPLIVQQVQDVPVGTAYVLILVDIEIHGQWMEAHFDIAPIVERRVIAVPSRLSRNALLSQANVYELCRFENMRCLVEYNSIVWHAQNPDPKTATFGDFAKIVIPPSLRCDVSTGELLADSRQLSIEEFWERYYEPSEPPEPSVHEGSQSAASDVSPSLLDSDDIRAEFGIEIEEQDDDVSVMQRELSTNAASSSDANPNSTPTITNALQNDTCVTTFSVDQQEWLPLWYRHLTKNFQESYTIEDVGEGPIVYVTTWFVTCTEEKTTEHSRIARLDTLPQFWVRDITQLWQDQIFPDMPIHFAWVYPTPLASPHSHTIGHLIVFQYPNPTFVPLVVSFHFTALGKNGVGNAATVVRRTAQPEHIVSLLKLDRVCRGRRCTIHRGTIGSTWEDALNTGEGLLLDIPSLGERAHLKWHTHPRSVAAVFPDEFVYPDDGFSMRIEDYSIFHQSLFEIWQRTSRQMPNSLERTLEVTTWYLDGTQVPYNDEQRNVVLDDDFSNWEAEILRTWTDIADAGEPLTLVFVKPVPPPSPPAQVHILAMQNMPFDSSGVVITRYDNAIQQGNPISFAVVVPARAEKHTILQRARIDTRDINPLKGVHCGLWHEGFETIDDTIFHLHHGFGLNVIIHRNVLHSWDHDENSDEQGFLQLHHSDPGSHKQQIVLCLDELVTDTRHVPHWVPVKLIHLEKEDAIPTELYLPEDYQAQDIEQDLQQLGHHRHAYPLPSTGHAIIVPIAWEVPDESVHYVYCPGQKTDMSEPICHRSNRRMSEHDHMKFLYQFGMSRAVIIKQHDIRRNLVVVHFHNNQPTLEDKQPRIKMQSQWPSPQETTVRSTIFDPSTCSSDKPLHCLKLGIDCPTLAQFFDSASDVLCPWFTHLDLPPFVKEGISVTVTQEGQESDVNVFDRLVIYTDGSSKAHERRKAPLQVELEGTPDAWAFAVIGECYPTADQTGSLTFLGWHAQRVRYDKDSSAFVGTEQIGAEFAEREAMIHACLWRLALNSNIPTVFRTDSTTTADQTTGRAGFNSYHPTIAVLRGLFQALQTSIGEDAIIVDHVMGHAGDIWNELVDFLAKTEASHGHYLRRQKIDLRVLGPAIPYLWLLFGQHLGLPQWTEFGFDVKPPQLPSLKTSVPAPNPAPKGRQVDFMISLASFNVGSLFLSPDGFGGKLSYLRHQMTEHALNILGVQEARSPPGLSVADDILRIAGGSDNGRFGVELWIALKQPFAFVGGKPQFLNRSQVQLLHHDPRRLLVCIVNQIFQCFVLVLHAPQSGRPVHERREWWQETTDLIVSQSTAYPVLVLVDANAKTGPSRPPVVFQHGDTSSSSTSFFHDFLAETALCLPSTSEIHQGSHDTWISPDGTSKHRIDFIAVPQTHLDRCTHSQVLYEFDNGNLNADHSAIAIQMAWKDECTISHRVSSVVKHERHNIESRKATISSMQIPAATWTTDVETQVQDLNQALHHTLQHACPRERARPKKAFISPETWALRTVKLHLRRRLHQARRQSAFDLVAKMFKHWSSRSSDMESEQQQAHMVSITCSVFNLSCKYWSCTKRLKLMLQNDRNQRLQEVLKASGPETAASTPLNVLKPFIGTTNPKKQKRACLPIVKDAHGEICKSPAAALNRWVQFFSEMEGGQQMSVQQYRQHWIAGLKSFNEVPEMDLAIQNLPTLTELEMAFRRVMPGKAVGLDSIPPELCRHCPVLLAKACYSLMLKVALFGQEAMEHKGGQLAIAWKQKGDVRDCHSHRSLLVSSHVGKSIHRALRQKYNGLYCAFMQRQQLGGRPHMPVGIPLHISRAFVRWNNRRKLPTALVFLDLTEAFYRTLRPLAVGGLLSEHCISLMCKRLGFGTDALHELFTLLNEPSAVEEAQAPPHVIRMLQALHRDTWFILGQQEGVVRTEIGSRPGDGFADVVFGFLWAKLLRQLEEQLTSHGILEHIPDIEYPDPYQSVRTAGCGYSLDGTNVDG